VRQVRKAFVCARYSASHIIVVTGNHLAKGNLLAGTVPRLIVIDGHVTILQVSCPALSATLPDPGRRKRIGLDGGKLQVRQAARVGLPKLGFKLLQSFVQTAHVTVH